MDHYEVLGVPRDARPDDIRHAYLAKVHQLHPDKYSGAPDEVRRAVTETLAIVNEAGRILQDQGLRADYDRSLDHRAAAVTGTHVVHEPAPGSGGLNDGASTPSMQMFGVLPLYESLSALELVTHWRSPTHDKKTEVTVPDVRGMRASEMYYALGEADLHARVVHLTEDPAPVDGTVMDQDPPPGTSLRRFSTVTVQVWHPSATGSIAPTS
jgi:curved DNA-binding protein CbpA